MELFSSREPISFSERLYRLLLRAYPRAFRRDFAQEMALTFRDAYRETLQREGRAGLARLWGVVVYDLLKTVCIEHVKAFYEHGERDFALAGKEHIAMALQFSLDLAQRTDIGRTRQTNEDNLVSVVPDDADLLAKRGALFVVSDGMGGHEKGEVASELAVQKVKEYYYQDTDPDLAASLRRAIEQANASIRQAAEEAQQRGANGHMMGATCVAAVVHEHMLYAANVGDSRVYILRDGELRQITRDHSIVADMVARGEIKAEEARTHEKRNIIYRSLGTESVEVDTFSEPVQDGDTLILCTDGLSGVLGDDELRAIVERYGPEESVQQLVARANELGGPDNITAIVARIGPAQKA